MEATRAWDKSIKTKAMDPLTSLALAVSQTKMDHVDRKSLSKGRISLYARASHSAHFVFPSD